MMPQQRRGASLNPDVMLPELIIDQLLGPGVTIIGSEEPLYRYALQIQMAIAIAKGEKFLRILHTQKSEVLYVPDGAASYKDGKARFDTEGVTDVLHVYLSWDRIEQGGIHKLEEELKRFPLVKVAFLGDFEEIRSFQTVWLKKYLKPSKLGGSLEKEEKSQGTNDPFANQDMKRVMARDNVNRLKRASHELATSIVIGGDLNTKRKLYDRDGLKYRNNEVHIYKSSSKVKLEVRPGGNVLPKTWDLYFDDEKQLFLPAGDLKPQARKSQSQKLPLLQDEKAIIDVLWDKVLPASEIAGLSGIPRSTVYQRLEALQQEKKGCWIVSFEAGGMQRFYVNPDKKKDKDW